jgi:hypothetical protein
MKMKKRIHSPFDDLAQPYSEQAFHTAIKFNFLTTFHITTELETITWNKQSWLYKKYVLGQKIQFPE